jgi:hypothetical protein
MIEGHTRDLIFFTGGAAIVLLAMYLPFIRFPWKDPIGWIALKPCKFCGSKDARLKYVHGGEQAFCFDCKAHGPVKPQGKEAVEAWNGASLGLADLLPTAESPKPENARQQLP